MGFQICSPDIIIMAPRHVAICHTDQMQPETEDDGRWRKQTEDGGSRKMEETALESADFRHKFGPWHVGFPDMLSRYHQPGPIHVSIGHTDQMRPQTVAGGRRRNLTEADAAENGIRGARFGIVHPQIWPMACWVSRYALPKSPSCPQTCFHETHGPDATRNGCRRKMAESDGS